MVSLKEYGGSLLLAEKDQLVDQGRKLYVDALVGKGQSQELEY